MAKMVFSRNRGNVHSWPKNTRFRRFWRFFGQKVKTSPKMALFMGFCVNCVQKPLFSRFSTLRATCSGFFTDRSVRPRITIDLVGTNGSNQLDLHVCSRLPHIQVYCAHLTARPARTSRIILLQTIDATFETTRTHTRKSFRVSTQIFTLRIKLDARRMNHSSCYDTLLASTPRNVHGIVQHVNDTATL